MSIIQWNTFQTCSDQESVSISNLVLSSIFVLLITSILSSSSFVFHLSDLHFHRWTNIIFDVHSFRTITFSRCFLRFFHIFFLFNFFTNFFLSCFSIRKKPLYIRSFHKKPHKSHLALFFSSIQTQTKPNHNHIWWYRSMS